MGKQKKKGDQPTFKGEFLFKMIAVSAHKTSFFVIFQGCLVLVYAVTGNSQGLFVSSLLMFKSCLPKVTKHCTPTHLLFALFAEMVTNAMNSTQRSQKFMLAFQLHSWMSFKLS